MTRHGRNATNSAVYTYHERQKDSAASGYGTDKVRLSKDSLKPFDCCSLTLQPCKSAVVTSEGWLFDKEPLFTYMITKKREYARKCKEFDVQRKKKVKELAGLADAEKEANILKFEKSEKSILPFNSNSKKETTSTSKLPTFWFPEEITASSSRSLSKPDKTIYCPMSGLPLRMKDLVDVKFTEIKNEDDKKSLIAKSERYMCAVTHDVLYNSTPVAVLRSTGHVVTVECVNKIILKDNIHPLSGQTIDPLKEIIYLQRGGTGYASANNQLEATHYRPNLAIA